MRDVQCNSYLTAIPQDNLRVEAEKYCKSDELFLTHINRNAHIFLQLLLK